jgi:type IV secretory pathway VirB10-like protein
MARMPVECAPTPSRRNRGGVPAGCIAVVLAWLLVLSPAARAAPMPTPDPSPQGNVQPDPAPGSSSPAPTIQAPVQRPVIVQQQPATSNRPLTVRRVTGGAGAPTTSSRAAASRAQARRAAHQRAVRAKAKARAGARERARTRERRQQQVAASEAAARSQLVAQHPAAALTATRRVAGMLGFQTRPTTSGALSNSDLYAAAALLLLLVAASASVLRLSTRMASDFPGGRFG